MNDVYQTPESELKNSQKRDYKLYKMAGLGVASFFGSCLAGGYLMAQNFKKMGRYDLAKRTMLFSLAGLIVIVVASFLLPEGVSVNTVLTILQVVIILQVAKKYQGEFVDEHIREGGDLFSNWRAFGISLLFIIGIFIVAFIAVFILAAIFGMEIL